MMTDEQRRQILVCAFAFGIMFLLSLPWQPYPGDFFIKGAGIVLLALYVFLSRANHRLFIVTALLFSASGDVLLAQGAFVAGLSSFLIAHLIYIAVFVTIGRSEGRVNRARFPYAAGLVVAITAYLAWLWPDLGSLRGPVAAYMAVITGMGVAALVIPFRSRLIFLGAFTFIFSDGVIALDRFKIEFAAADYVIWIAYFAAQVMIVFGYLRHMDKSPVETRPTWVASLTDNLRNNGLDLTHTFSVQDYNQAVDGSLKLETYGRDQTLTLLIANTRNIWPHFSQSLHQQPNLAGTPNPLYTNVERVVREALQSSDIPVECSVRWAHAEGDKLIAIQKLADASGFAKQGPMGLNIHDIYGPWIGLRAVITFDVENLEKSAPTEGPCASCDKPCLAPLDAAMKATESLTSDNVEANWELWLATRDACPVGRQHRYFDDQIRYHYTKDRSVIERLAADEKL